MKRVVRGIENVEEVGVDVEFEVDDIYVGQRQQLRVSFVLVTLLEDRGQREYC